MKKYKLYKKVQPVYVNGEELLRYIILPLIIITYISYPILYFFGITATIVYNVSIAVTVVYFKRKMDRLLNILQINFQIAHLQSIVVRCSMFVMILTVLVITDFGFYILVLYQKNNQFNLVHFYCWLLLLFGLPLVYYTIRSARYHYIKNQQDQDYTTILLHVNYELDNFVSIENIQFVNSLNRKSSNIRINKNIRVYSQKEFVTKKSKTRNHYINSNGVREVVHIPSSSNLFLLSWFSLTEDKYYDIEMPFSLEKRIKMNRKPATNNLSVVRGRELKMLQLKIYKNGGMKLFTKDEVLIDCSENKYSESDEECKNVKFK